MKAQFHLGWLRRKVRVRPASPRGVALNYAIHEEQALAINDFVTKHGLGYRSSYDTWRLNSAEAKTMFVLRWS